MSEINKPVVGALAIIIISQLILFVLKMTNVINWGWGWILAPLWIPYIVCIILGVFIILYLLICDAKERIFKKHE